MKYHCIGRVQCTDRMDYMIYDELSDMVGMFEDDHTRTMMSINGVKNLGIKDGKIEFNNGIADRYGLWAQRNKVKDAIIVIKKYVYNSEAFMYKIYNTTKGIQHVSKDELIEIGKRVGIANAKVVETSSGRHIASINGEFEIEELKYINMKIDQKVSFEEFEMFLNLRGCKIVRGGGKFEVTGEIPQLVIENLSIPKISKTTIEFKMPIRVKNMTIMSSGVEVIGCKGSYIEELRLTGEEMISSIRINNIPVKTCSTHGEVQVLRWVNIWGGVKRFIGGVSLKDVIDSISGNDLELIDLRQCVNGEEISGSFGDTTIESGKVIKMWVGDFKRFDKVLQDSIVELVDFFNENATTICGFGQIKGRSKLDFSNYVHMAVLGGMSKCYEVKEVLLPLTEPQSRVRLSSAFLSEVKLDHVFIPDEPYRAYNISDDSLSNVRVLELGQWAYMSERGTDSNIEVIKAKRYDNISTIPGIPSKSGVKIVFPEGTEIIVESNRGWRKVSEIVLPKSLKEIGKFAFASMSIDSINMEDTRLEKIGRGAFSDTSYYGDIIMLPDTVKVIEDRAFLSEKIDELYVPKSVESIGKNFFRGKILYTAKGGLVDKTRKGSYVKVYVDSLEGLKAHLEEKKSSNRDIAKVTMAMGSKEGYEWLKDSNYTENAKFIMEVDKALKDVNDEDRGIELDKSKYIDFSIDKLGYVGSEITKLLPNNFRTCEVKMSDKFKVMSNFITKGTRFYAGHFTSKALKRFGSSEEEVKKFIGSIQEKIVYSENGCSIILMSMKNSRSIVADDAFAVVIMIGDRIKYTTLVRFSMLSFLYEMGNPVGAGNRIEDFITEGDLIQHELRGITLSRINFPRGIETKAEEWVSENLLMVHEFKPREMTLISMHTGKIYTTRYYERGYYIDKIISPEKHKYDLSKIVPLEAEGDFRYFDMINGVVKPQIEVMQSKTPELIQIMEKLSKLGRRIYGNELVELILECIDKVPVKVNVTQLWKAELKYNMEDYVSKELKNKEALKKMGYCRNVSTVYLVAKKDERWYEGNDVVDAYLVAHDLCSVINTIYLANLDKKIPEPKFMQKYTVREMEEAFVFRTNFDSKGLSICLSKHSGKPYLVGIKKIGDNMGAVKQCTVLGELRDEIEALKVIQDGLQISSLLVGYEYDAVGLGLAEEARKGKIPVGAYPEYTMNYNKIYEVLGL